MSASSSKFIAYRKSLELVALIQKVVMPRLKAADTELASQLHRAARSIPLNVAEGSAQRGKRRGNQYAMALGSNREVDAVLDVAVSLGILRADAVAPVYALSDETQAMLYVLSR